MKTFIALCINVGTMPIWIYFHAKLFQKLWLWFIEPQFHLAAISLPEAAGLALIIDLLTFRFVDEPENKKSLLNQAVTRMFQKAIVLSLLWGIGATLHSYLP